MSSVIPETLVESELFGPKRGAFTGATEDRQGQFELANGGTIFLDEIGDMTPETQVKLLRVLENGIFRPLRSGKERHCEVRVIAATNQNLTEMVEDGTFREDLYYRLNVIPLYVPPLRKRREDIPLLVDNFIARDPTSDEFPSLSSPVERFLMEYDYPGNVRQLKNIIKHALVSCKGPKIEIEHLHEKLQYEIIDQDEKIVYRELKKKVVEKWERDFFSWLPTKTKGNVSKAADHANMDYRYLLKRLNEYGIEPKQFRDK